MKFVVLYESEKRIRIKTPIINMSLRQADLLEYYLKSIPEVKEASVDERTENAVIVFQNSDIDKRAVLQTALSVYDENSDAVTALVPENSGRELNHHYQERLIFQVFTHFASKLFLPLPIRTVRTVVKSIPFLIRGIRSLSSCKLKVELLDAIAIGASILQKDYATAGSIIFLLNTGDTLQEWTRKKSINDLAHAMSLNVENAWVDVDGQLVEMPVRSIHTGDRFVVRSSDIIPLDGKVVSGTMMVNQSAMTGEAEPVAKEPGSYVFAGTVVDEGECTIEVTKEAGSGKYDQIVHMIEESEKLKSDTEAKAYRLADSLVPYSFLGFASVYALTRNLTKALSFLMVDYSCAMKLSMPLAVLSAIKEARNYGITIKGGKSMELVADVDTIVFDKTGTLTCAQPKLVDVITFGDHDPDEMLRIAACLEEHYPHSVANAIVNGAKEKGLNHDELHSRVEYIVAHGVSSFVGEEKTVIGSRHFVLEDENCCLPEGAEEKLNAIPEEYSRVYLAVGGVLSAVFCIFDPPREEAADVIKKLRSLGISHICMMTGDNRVTAKNIADRLGLDEYQAEVLPADKASFVQQEKAKGRRVMMVGDGINDSPALSEADIGVSIDSGAAITKEISDITISDNDLNELVILRKISMGLMERIHSNYRFIVGFNSGLIGLSLAGIISPASSALLHNSSTILTGLKSTTNLLEK